MIKKGKRDRGLTLIIMIMIFGCTLSLLSWNIPQLNEFLMPRFGPMGLLLYAIALIFLIPWFFSLANIELLLAAFVTFAITILNAKSLYERGTVGIVETYYSGRLHSSWLWHIMPFFLFGVYMCFVFYKNLTKKFSH